MYRPEKSLHFLVNNPVVNLHRSRASVGLSIYYQSNNGGENSSEVTLQVELSNNKDVILFQNEPNPFDVSTIIRYFISENIFGDAYMLFYDKYGREIKQLEIKEKGFGKIEVNAENLADGIYTYSIMVNNSIIDSKKMIRAH